MTNKLEEFLKTAPPSTVIGYDHTRNVFGIYELDDGYDPGYWGESIEQAIESSNNNAKHPNYPTKRSKA